MLKTSFVCVCVCVCGISISQMAREMDEILREQVTKQAESCKTEDGVSFLEKVISPLYEVVAAVCGARLFVLLFSSKVSILHVYFCLIDNAPHEEGTFLQRPIFFWFNLPQMERCLRLELRSL